MRLAELLHNACVRRGDGLGRLAEEVGAQLAKELEEDLLDAVQVQVIDTTELSRAVMARVLDDLAVRRHDLQMAAPGHNASIRLALCLVCAP
jgi:hypothetical protein